MTPTKQKSTLLNTCIRLKIQDLYGVDNKGFGQFAFVDVITKGKTTTLTAETRWYGCRGYMCETLAELKLGQYQVRKLYSAPPVDWQGAPLENFLDKHEVFHLLIRDLTQEQMFQAVKLLNYLESTSDWNKSEYIDLKLPNSYLLITDKKWIRAMPYFSLLMLLIRINKHRLFEPTDTLFTYTKNMAKDRYENRQYMHSTDKVTLYNMYKWYTNTTQVLMKNIEYITEQVREDSTTIDDIQRFHGMGIQCITSLIPSLYALKDIHRRLLVGAVYFGGLSPKAADMYKNMIYRLHEKIAEQGTKRNEPLPLAKYL